MVVWGGEGGEGIVEGGGEEEESRSVLVKVRRLEAASCSAETHQGRALSSQRTNVPPRLLSLTLEVQGLLQGVTLGWTPWVSPVEGRRVELRGGFGQ